MHTLICSTSEATTIDNPAYGEVPHKISTAGGLSDTSPEYAEVYTEVSTQESTSNKETVFV